MPPAECQRGQQEPRTQQSREEGKNSGKHKEHANLKQHGNDLEFNASSRHRELVQAVELHERREQYHHPHQGKHDFWQLLEHWSFGLSAAYRVSSVGSPLAGNITCANRQARIIRICSDSHTILARDMNVTAWFNKPYCFSAYRQIGAKLRSP